MALTAGEGLTAGPIPNRSRLLVFTLGGDATLPPAEPRELVIDPPAQTASAETVDEGKKLYLQYCVFCHGDGAVSGGVTPDLRTLTPEKHAQFQAIVRGGLHWEKGMVGFSDRLGESDVEAIRAYLVDRAHYSLASKAGNAAE
jgi:mono/diheme cytochrome c family protein